ncbi:MAG TPA: hypothetical protein VHY91_20830 [Pirellulales bacterium]|nr:hypothetical protein [Pirellulales bacterium]
MSAISNHGIANASGIKNPFQGNSSSLGNKGIAGGLNAATGSAGKPNLTNVASGMASSITPAGGLGTGTNVGPFVTGGFGTGLPIGGGYFGGFPFGGLPFGGGFGGGGYGGGMPAYSGAPQVVDSDPAVDAGNQPIASTAAATNSQTTATSALPLNVLALSQPANSNGLPLGGNNPQLASAASNPTSNVRALHLEELNAPLDPNAGNQGVTVTQTTGGTTTTAGGTTTVTAGTGIVTTAVGGTTDVTDGTTGAFGGTTTATGGTTTVQGGTTTIQGGTVTQNADGSQTVTGGTVTNTGGTVINQNGTLHNQGGQVRSNGNVENQGGTVTTNGTVVNQGGTISNTGGTTTTGTVPPAANNNGNPNGTNPNAADPNTAVATGFPLPFGGFGGGLPLGGFGGGGGFAGPAMGGGISDPGIPGAGMPVADASSTPAAMADLAITDIAVVDNGDPVQHLGPSYRITIANNSTVPVNQQFDVKLLAGNTSQPSGDLPGVSTRLTGLAPGQSTQVELRMLSGTTFSYLFPIVDNAQEVPDANPANNLAAVAATPTQTR